MKKKLLLFITMILLVISLSCVYGAEQLTLDYNSGNILDYAANGMANSMDGNKTYIFNVYATGWYRFTYKGELTMQTVSVTKALGGQIETVTNDGKQYYKLEANTPYTVSMEDYENSKKDKYDSAVVIEDLNNDTNSLQWVITDLNLAIGDFINDLITKIVGKRITIQSLIFNEVDAVNANFFSNDTRGTSVHKTVKEQVNFWYANFQAIAVTFYLAALLIIGIKVVLSESTLVRAGMKETIMHWLTGVLILFLFNFVMRYAFQINEAFIKMIKAESAVGGGATGTYIGDASEFGTGTFEFRSPEYRSKYSGVLSYGGTELNNAYLSRIEEYRGTADMMRIMRAYAGVSHKIIFCIIWFVLLFQLIIMLVKYYKRYFIIALLITIFPFVTIFYLIDSIKGRRCEAFRVWCVEFFVNVFTQSIHAIIYSVIASVCIKQVIDEMHNSSTMNWLIIIIAINFLFQGEKIVRKLLGADGSNSMRTIGESARAGRQGLKVGRGHLKDLGHAFGIGKGK